MESVSVNKNSIMKKALLFGILSIVGIAPLHATTWRVGPSRSYTAPSQVSTLVQNGDTVLIDSGVYESDVARWSASNLLLMGNGGFAHLKSNGANYGGKAIWVIDGNNTTVESIEFSLCGCPDKNGAGIRQEGSGLTVRGCFFHDNQEGILAGDNPTSDILIEYSEFYNNGAGDGYSHNLYINHVNSLTFRFNYSHHAVVGHELKSRAYSNYILYNRLANESTGTASREIDLPNGGTAIIIGNEIEQGAQGTNSGIIGYGLEGLSNPTPHDLYLVNNTIVNDKNSGTFVSLQEGTALYKGYNNIFAGSGVLISGTPTALDTSANLSGSIAAMGFSDAAAYDYRLSLTSPAVDAGVDPGYADTFALAPEYVYVYPMDEDSRLPVGGIDIGAHEWIALANVAMSPLPGAMMDAYPNPAGASMTIRISGAGNSRLVICNEVGNVVLSAVVASDAVLPIARDRLPAGVYFARLIRNDGVVEATKTLVVN